MKDRNQRQNTHCSVAMRRGENAKTFMTAADVFDFETMNASEQSTTDDYDDDDHVCSMGN